MEIERLGPYQIVGKLGRGGMGTVFEAVHRETGEPAAVKLLSAALAREEGFRSRFEAEIETLRKLRHPNIVRLFGFGEQEGELFYAMELVDGDSLEEELRNGRVFDWREVTQIGIETCRALRHAHDRGVIHRDIKPGNLLLTAERRVKLSDFGIARLFGHTRLTSAGNILGTAEYMSPEQAEGKPVNARADLYSLGALLYALLARRPLFHGKSLAEMIYKQRFESPEPLKKHVPDVPDEMERILQQLLQKEPGQRMPNADVLARRLEAMLHGLRLGPETVDADARWFDPDECAARAQVRTRTLPLSDELPITQAINPAVKAGEREDRHRGGDLEIAASGKCRRGPGCRSPRIAGVHRGRLSRRCPRRSAAAAPGAVGPDAVSPDAQEAVSPDVAAPGAVSSRLLPADGGQKPAAPYPSLPKTPDTAHRTAVAHQPLRGRQRGRVGENGN